jgi:hypothetical protein
MVSFRPLMNCERFLHRESIRLPSLIHPAMPSHSVVSFLEGPIRGVQLPVKSIMVREAYVIRPPAF